MLGNERHLNADFLCRSLECLELSLIDMLSVGGGSCLGSPVRGWSVLNHDIYGEICGEQKCMRPIADQSYLDPAACSGVESGVKIEMALGPLQVSVRPGARG